MYLIEDEKSYYLMVGHIAMAWAAFEAIVSSSMWRIGEIPDRIGACLTSQIWTINTKFDALVALIQVRDPDKYKSVVKALNKFLADEVVPLSRFRNRTVHDPININIETGKVDRLEISAQRNLKLGYVPQDIEYLKKKHNEIAVLIDTFADIIKPVLDDYPSLPRTSTDKSQQ